MNRAIARSESLVRPLVVCSVITAVIYASAFTLLPQMPDPTLASVLIYALIAMLSLSAGLFVGWLIDVGANWTFLGQNQVRLIGYSTACLILTALALRLWAPRSLLAGIIFLLASLAGVFWKYIRRLFRIKTQPMF